jgi:hypothetical protein
MSGRDLFIAAISSAIFPDGVPDERPKTALERTIEAHEAGIGLRSSHGAARREAFIAKVVRRRTSDKKRNKMRKASQRRNRA